LSRCSKSSAAGGGSETPPGRCTGAAITGVRRGHGL